MLLIIDNYDSFTYNLLDYFMQLEVDCRVARNDEIDLPEIEALNPHAIVISPGPGRPENSGITRAVIEHYFDKKPILGICLGHQAIGEFFGAKLEEASYPMHGKTSTIHHNGDVIFNRLPPHFEVMRYHSLVLKNIGEKDLEVIAKTEANEAMAIKHRHHNLYGLQFHPESILTQHGIEILRNWVRLVFG